MRHACITCIGIVNCEAVSACLSQIPVNWYQHIALTEEDSCSFQIIL